MVLPAIALVLTTLALAQTPEFEVASIKPTATKDGSLSVRFLPGGRYSIRNLTLKQLLESAYSMQDYQVAGGPPWITESGFDIEAKGAGDPTREQMLQMVQTLLTDRFHLAMHRETRQLPVYALVVAKNGPKLQPAAANAGYPKLKRGEFVIPKMSMAELANLLVLDVKRPVKDETGLQGNFAFTLEWNPDLRDTVDQPGARPSIFTALQEQLGLKLESTKGPVEVLVIDRAEKPTEN